VKLLLVVALLALAVYLTIRIIQRRGVAPAPPRRPTRPTRRFIAPDDDEEFLRDLERKRRHPEEPDDPWPTG